MDNIPTVQWIGDSVHPPANYDKTLKRLIFYKACRLGDIEVSVGDYVLISQLKHNKADSTDDASCDVARINFLYECQDLDIEDDRFRANVKWFSRPWMLPKYVQHDFLDNEFEVVEDCRSYSPDVSIETFIRRCMLVFGSVNKNALDLFSECILVDDSLLTYVCRYRLVRVPNNARKMVLKPVEFKTEDKAAASKYNNMSVPRNIPGKSNSATKLEILSPLSTHVTSKTENQSNTPKCLTRSPRSAWSIQKKSKNVNLMRDITNSPKTNKSLSPVIRLVSPIKLINFPSHVVDVKKDNCSQLTDAKIAAEFDSGDETVALTTENASTCHDATKCLPSRSVNHLKARRNLSSSLNTPESSVELESRSVHAPSHDVSSRQGSKSNKSTSNNDSLAGTKSKAKRNLTDILNISDISTKLELDNTKHEYSPVVNISKADSVDLTNTKYQLDKMYVLNVTSSDTSKVYSDTSNSSLSKNYAVVRNSKNSAKSMKLILRLSDDKNSVEKLKHKDAAVHNRSSDSSDSSKNSYNESFIKRKTLRQSKSNRDSVADNECTNKLTMKSKTGSSSDSSVNSDNERSIKRKTRVQSKRESIKHDLKMENKTDCSTDSSMNSDNERSIKRKTRVQRKRNSIKHDLKMENKTGCSSVESDNGECFIRKKTLATKTPEKTPVKRSPRNYKLCKISSIAKSSGLSNTSKQKIRQSARLTRRSSEQSEVDGNETSTSNTRRSSRTVRKDYTVLFKHSPIEETPSKHCGSSCKTPNCKSIMKTPTSKSKPISETSKKVQLKEIVEESPDEDILKTPKRKVVAQNKTPRTTPASKMKQFKAGMMTPNLQIRNTPHTPSSGGLGLIRERLHVSFVPKSLPCRENEFNDIFTFIQGKLVDESGGCMYISGVPGTGKTATVTEVINCLKYRKEVPTFEYVEINGMRLTEPRQAYVHIHRQLTGLIVPWAQAQSLLDKRFTAPVKRKLPIVLLLDELDILCTRRQDVVYTLLDWPSKARAQLIVVAIANTMDLPERLLRAKVTSRLGLTRLTFSPYTHKQLMDIVTSRLTGTALFNSDAVQLVARKVAAVSGDARRALDICRRATEIAEFTNASSSSDGVIVSMVDVNKALSEMIASPKVCAIQSCSLIEQLFLQAVAAEVSRTGVEETTFSHAYLQLTSLCASEGTTAPAAGTALAVCCSLGASRLLITEEGRADLFMRILLNVGADDIHYALSQY